jgi:hypothetical protein
VIFVSAHEDGFQTLPAERIFRKECHFGIAPSETVISYNVRSGAHTKCSMKVGTCSLGGVLWEGNALLFQKVTSQLNAAGSRRWQPYFDRRQRPLVCEQRLPALAHALPLCKNLQHVVAGAGMVVVCTV